MTPIFYSATSLRNFNSLTVIEVTSQQKHITNVYISSQKKGIGDCDLRSLFFLIVYGSAAGLFVLSCMCGKIKNDFLRKTFKCFLYFLIAVIVMFLF